MSGAEMNVRLATEADRSAIVDTVVAAFDQDPAFRYFLGNDGFPEKATAFVEYLFDKRIVHNTVWVTDKCEAVSLWSPPTSMFTDDHRKLSVQLQAIMRERIGPTAAARLDIYDAAVDVGLPTEPHWYLGILAAHPALAEKGAGRAVMEAGLAHVREHDGLAVLETTNPRNPAYYERAGWALANTVECATPSTIWVMHTR
jgi:GNAT superfamily N-acetyltransferase